jgi:hypothetical protein
MHCVKFLAHAKFIIAMETHPVLRKHSGMIIHEVNKDILCVCTCALGRVNEATTTKC